MVLLSEVKYKTSINDLKDISSESILAMLHDVRADIGKLDCAFVDVDLANVLTVVEKGEYIVNGRVSVFIDLSSAKNIIETYRKYSEGGCRSCMDLGREVVDAQDAKLGFYCKVYDPDYDVIKGVKYVGFSPKVKEYYNNPCDSWRPRCFPRIEKLIKK